MKILFLILCGLLAAFAIMVFAGCGHVGDVPDLTPLDPNWDISPVMIPIVPPPAPLKQHARIELWAPIELESRDRLVEYLEGIPTACKAEILLSVECLHCYRKVDFWTYEDLPKNSIKCPCGQDWIIRYLEE